MDCSPVLRQQSQKKIHSDHIRRKNEHNKMPVDLKPSKHVPVPHFSKRDVENQHPGSLETVQKAPVRAGVSRLPVLAKSFHLQTPSDFTHSHKRWEEKPLAGKAKQKRPCTKPVPFNLSQPKSTRMATQNQTSLSRTGTHVVQTKHILSAAHPKTKNLNGKLSNCPAVVSHSNGDSTQGAEEFQRNRPSGDELVGSYVPGRTVKAAENTSHMSQQPRPSGALSSSATLSGHVSAEACLHNMDLLSLKEPPNAPQSVQATTPCVHLSKSSAGKGEAFQPDHAALLSILRDEGVSAMDPQTVKPYNYLPQRVSVMKSRQKAGPATGPAKSVQFSPDPAALRSILQNEGVKAGGPLGATPQNAVCPSGRGTSIYTAQRVPVTKSRAETTGGSVAALKETPVKKWTPQRVPDTRHQPMSAMASIHKRLLSAHRTSLAGSSSLRALRGCNTDLQPHKEEIVQRLFDDQEDEQTTDVTDKEPETQAKQLPASSGEVSGTCGDEEEEEEEEQEHRSAAGQPFLQEQHRESVIFFSTGKKLFRVPRFEKQDSCAHLEQQGTVSSTQRPGGPAREETSSGSDTTRHMNPCILSFPRDLTGHKSCAQSPAVALLRRRLPPLEELRMDEEVATYTSVSAPAPSGFLLPRPRCGNPLASILHFQEATTFIPVGSDCSSDPPSPCCSPLWER
uniref:Uncharacterized LOC115362528 n=1 Tax=Myripristis murdjan TaxID=586833 RepID=A0A668A6H3_9TELE